MIKSLLFERPVLLFVLCAAAEVIVARRWAQTRTTASGRAAIVGLLTTMILPLISLMVVTDRERVEEICRQAATAVDDGNLGDLRDLFDPFFDAGGVDREEFLRRAGEVLTRYRVDRVRLWNIEVDIRGPSEAEATFDSTCAVRSADAFVDAAPTRWRLHLRRTGESWRISDVGSIPIPPFFFRGLPQEPR